MTTANKITNYDLVARAKSLLLSQFKDKENINKIVEALIEQIQEIDDNAVALQQIRMLDNATGIYLDNIGEKLKVTRTTLDDDDYRTAIKVRMLKNKSRGSYKEIDEIINLLTYGEPHFINTTHPYVVELGCFLACLNTEDGLDLIKSLFPVNITVRVMNATATPFGFAGNPKARGFGSATEVGGQLCSMVKSFNGIVDDSRFISRETPITNPSQGSGNVIVPPATPLIPQLVMAPVITPNSDVYEGTVLTCSAGTWTSTTPLTYQYQWFRNNASILNSTASVYTVTAEDADTTLTCRVTTSNFSGTESIFTTGVIVLGESPSQQTGIVADLGLRPNYYIFDTESSVGLNIGFNTDGTVRAYGTNFPVVTTDYLSPAGSSAGFEISYTNSYGAPFTSPQQNVWYPLTAEVTFNLTVTQRERDKGGTQVITVREIATGISVSHTLTVAVSAEQNILL